MLCAATGGPSRKVSPVAFEQTLHQQAFTPCRRATSFTVTPATSVSATIWPFASSDQRRLADGAARSSTNPTPSIWRSRWTPNDTSRVNLHTEPHRRLRIQQEGGGGTALTLYFGKSQSIEASLHDHHPCRRGRVAQNIDAFPTALAESRLVLLPIFLPALLKPLDSSRPEIPVREINPLEHSGADFGTKPEQGRPFYASRLGIGGAGGDTEGTLPALPRIGEILFRCGAEGGLIGDGGGQHA